MTGTCARAAAFPARSRRRVAPTQSTFRSCVTSTRSRSRRCLLQATTWVDCDRPSNGGFNSLERLDHERQVFFNTPFSMGRHKLKQEVQSTPLCLGVAAPRRALKTAAGPFMM